MNREQLIARLEEILRNNGANIEGLIQELRNPVPPTETRPDPPARPRAPGITSVRPLDNGLLSCAWMNGRATWHGYINPTNGTLTIPNGTAVRPRGIVVCQRSRNYPVLPCHDWVPAFALGLARTDHPSAFELHPDHIWWPDWRGGLEKSEGGWAVAPYVHWRSHPRLVDQTVSELIGMAQRQDRLDPFEEVTGFDKEVWWGAEQSPFDLAVRPQHTVPELSHYMRNIRAAIALAALEDPFAKWYLGQCLHQQTWWINNEPFQEENTASYNLDQMTATTGEKANRMQGRHIAHLLYLTAACSRWAHNGAMARQIANRVVDWLLRTARSNGTNHLDDTGCRVWEERLVKCGVVLNGGRPGMVWDGWDQGDPKKNDPYSCPPHARWCNGTNPNGQDFGRWYRNLTCGKHRLYHTQMRKYIPLVDTDLYYMKTPHSLDQFEELDSVPGMGAW